MLEPRPPIALTVRIAEGRVALAVRDQGAGIPPDALPRLFKRFSRIVEEGRDRPTGVGLGLLIVKTVAERHGGSVSVESTPGMGSVFEIRLPLRSRPEAPSQPD